jgi:hypothetical protein
MTFLKKLGQVLLKVVGIAAGVGPIVEPFLGSGKAATVTTTAVNDLTSIGQVIAQIETAFAAIPNSTGAQKLQAALPLVSNIIATSELVVGKKVSNPALFTQACQEFTQATVDLLNAIDPNEVKTT